MSETTELAAKRATTLELWRSDHITDKIFVVDGTFPPEAINRIWALIDGEKVASYDRNALLTILALLPRTPPAPVVGDAAEGFEPALCVKCDHYAHVGQCAFELDYDEDAELTPLCLCMFDTNPAVDGERDECPNGPTCDCMRIVSSTAPSLEDRAREFVSGCQPLIDIATTFPVLPEVLHKAMVSFAARETEGLRAEIETLKNKWDAELCDTCGYFRSPVSPCKCWQLASPGHHERVRARLSEAVTALEIYADKGHWVCPDCLPGGSSHDHHPQRFWIKTTNGNELAQEYLAAENL